MDTADSIITERFLPAVAQPARFTGLEHNRRCGDLAAAEVTVALGFPDDYGVGVSHLGTQILYTLLNETPGVAADRFYCPDPASEAIMRQRGVRLFGWESRAELRRFDLVGISLSYEMTATNVLTMLDLAGVPLRADQRGVGDPIVIGGGTQADAPEPLADFFDIFLIGDGEANLPAFVELFRTMRRGGASRDDILLAAAQTIPSAYVPALWQCDYGPDGRLAALRPRRDDIPPRIARAAFPLADSPDITHPLVSVTAGVFDRISIEIMRGCPNACRFCHAGFTRNPVRRRSVETIVRTALAAVANTGFREISLLSLSTGDYPELRELLARLDAELTPRGVSISVPSLRIDKQLSELPERLNSVRKGGMTIAAEVGSDRLRQAINKPISNADLLAAVEAAYRAGWRSVKVYFMAGFPGESDADLDGIVELCREMSAVRRRVDRHPGAVSASVSWLVPKPHTPLQWAPQAPMDYFWHVRERLKSAAARSPVNFKFHTIERSVLEAAVARGDRRMGQVIEAAWRSGARYDAWREHFNYGLWEAAFRNCAVDPAWFTGGREVSDLLTWDHVAACGPRSALERQWAAYQEVMKI